MSQNKSNSDLFLKSQVILQLLLHNMETATFLLKLHWHQSKPQLVNNINL